MDKYDGYCIQVNCICLITTLEMRALVLPSLQTYHFWMDSQDIYEDRQSNHLWVKGAHTKFTFGDKV